jgi:hypothetical protein
MTLEHNRLPKTTANTQYPYNQVWVTESGHEVQFDNTPGAERIRIAHRKGTYTEISADGRRVDFNVGNHQQYNKGGVTITVDENSDIKISGHQRICVGGGSHIEVAGDANMVVGGDQHSVVGGNLRAAVAGDMYTGVKGNGNMHVAGSMNMEVRGDMTTRVRGTHHTIARQIKTTQG